MDISFRDRDIISITDFTRAEILHLCEAGRRMYELEKSGGRDSLRHALRFVGKRAANPPLGLLTLAGLLPREWTDEILPLKLNPQRSDLVRVMVGRAEIIPLQLQRELAIQLKLSNEGDAKAKARLQAYYQKMDRFYNPAIQLANDLLKREQNKPLATAAVN